jgi:P27 family predicted phage terminase small subunit
MRGRKPKPSFLRIIEGNPGKRPLNLDEPQPDGDLIDPPEDFEPGSDYRRTWEKIICDAPRGLLKRLDTGMLQIYVVACVQHAIAAKMIMQYGSVIKSPVQEQPMASPYVAQLNAQAKIMMKAASEMGFSPTSRSRVKVTGVKAKKSNRFEGLKTLPLD